MKYLRLVSLFVVLVLCLTMPGLAVTASDYCYFTETFEHDFSWISNEYIAHPHSGYYECGCGKRVYYNKSYYKSCVQCQKELCKEGLHYYLHDVNYTDNVGYAGYGECYCGKRKYFNCTEQDAFAEVYPGILDHFGDLYSLKHPHYEYNQNTGRLIYEDVEDDRGIIYPHSCPVCQMYDFYCDEIEALDYKKILGLNRYYYYDYDEEMYCYYYAYAEGNIDDQITYACNYDYHDYLDMQDERDYNDDEYYFDEPKSEVKYDEYYAEEPHYNNDETEKSYYFEGDEFSEWLDFALEVLTS